MFYFSKNRYVHRILNIFILIGIRYHFNMIRFSRNSCIWEQGRCGEEYHLYHFPIIIEKCLIILFVFLSVRALTRIIVLLFLRYSYMWLGFPMACSLSNIKYVACLIRFQGHSKEFRVKFCWFMSMGKTFVMYMNDVTLFLTYLN